MDCYDSARRYAAERIQFGKPIASFQLVQKKLAEMLTEITKAQLLNWRLGMLMNEGKATTLQISLAKRNNVQVALGDSPRSPPDTRRHGHYRRIPHYAPHDESGVGSDLRGYARHSLTDIGQ